MVKIKVKKKMNLPQLIEWAWDNDVRGQLFPTDQNQEAGIYIATNRDFMMSNADYIKYSNTFTVEVEEVVTEDTKVPFLIERSVSETNNFKFIYHENMAISHCIDYKNKTFYVLNHDDTMTLIWRNGRLIKE